MNATKIQEWICMSDFIGFYTIQQDPKLDTHYFMPFTFYILLVWQDNVLLVDCVEWSGYGDLSGNCLLPRQMYPPSVDNVSHSGLQ